VRYEQQTEPQERSVLQQDVQHDTPHVNGTATRTAARADSVPATHVTAPRDCIVSAHRATHVSTPRERIVSTHRATHVSTPRERIVSTHRATHVSTPRERIVSTHRATHVSTPRESIVSAHRSILITKYFNACFINYLQICCSITGT